MNLKRTHLCGEVSINDLEKEIIVCGWLFHKRNHNQVYFFNLRDRSGIVQLVIKNKDENFALLDTLHLESCLAVKGKVVKRPDDMINNQMATGNVEIEVSQIEVFSASKVTPIPVNHETQTEISENLRLKYRYLDLRNTKLSNNLVTKSNMYHVIRHFFYQEGFIEIETPTFVRSTPEGARDFLVPSRLKEKHFYALAQSPQIYKQLSMIGGMDKYVQIARCYRDEDPRGDRQPEFAQLDFEASFIDQEYIFKLVENCMKLVFKNVIKQDLKIPFFRLSYDEALEKYGTDKPDLRFFSSQEEMALRDFSAFVKNNELSFVKEAQKLKYSFKALLINDEKKILTRKKLSELENLAKQFGLAGLPWMRVGEKQFDGGVGKFFQNEYSSLKQAWKLQNGQIIIWGCGAYLNLVKALGAIRQNIREVLYKYDDNYFAFSWITDFPLFEWDEQEKKYKSLHHPFSRPNKADEAFLNSDPLKVKGQLYDLVLNGYELGSGSMRIYDAEMQAKIFEILQLTEKEIESKFGFFVEALRYGTPPHGGMALGLDRLAMILCHEKSLKEVLAFPKTNVGFSPLDGSPSIVDQSQLDQLSLK